MATASATTHTLDVSHRHIAGIAGPILLSNAMVPLLGAVDTAVVGHLGTAEPIGAVAVGALVFTYVVWALGFLRSGTAGLSARALGADDGGEVIAQLGRAMLLGITIGVILFLAQDLIWAIADRAVDASAPVKALAQDYITARFWGTPAQLANFAILGWFMGQGRTRAVLGLQLFLNGFNMLLDFWFVMGLDWGVWGVGIASTVAEWTTLGLGLILIRGRIPHLPRHDTITGFWDAAKWREVGIVNSDLFIRAMFLTTAFVWITIQGAKAGDIVLAANALMLHVLTISAHGQDGFAIAAESLIGQAIGKRDEAKLRLAIRRTFIWAIGAGVIIAILWLIGRDLFLSLMTNVDEVQAATTDLWHWAVIMPLVTLWCFQLDGIYIGLGGTRIMRNAMVICFAGYIGLWALLDPHYGNQGLWAAFTIFFGLRAMSLGLWLKRTITESLKPVPAGDPNAPAHS